MSKKILVTGANGFIAMHIVDQLIRQGHHVRGTIRNLNDQEKVDSLKKLGPIEIYQADLLDAESWLKPCEECDIVMHVASPLPVVQPSDEDLIIKPAVQGTLNVLNAAFKNNIKRVVLTSSGLTVSGYDYQQKTYSESDWVPIENARTAYQKSKILAEKAAWEFVNEKKKNNQACFDLAVIIPVFVLGPILSNAAGSSVSKFLKMFDTNIEKIENMHFATCDVRDVALGHIKAAFLEEAVGNRNIIVSQNSLLSFKDWYDILVKEFEPKGYRITKVVSGSHDKDFSATKFDNSRMINVLGIKPTEFRLTLVDMTNSLIHFGLAKKN